MNKTAFAAAAFWLASYVATYCLLVEPVAVIDCTPPFKVLWVQPYYRVPGGQTDLLIPFFWLAHIPDRLIRPDVWNPDSN